ncbi:heterodisulfide reductase, subunit B [Candidatus Bathyarchaeota archaeon]|nr:MAG: heterodisulfide reductase, subunit B [Candidatus Bathyarchaeota archaeon]
MRFAYYPGCTLKTTARNYEDSALASARALGMELLELPRWNCCGTVHALAKDDVMHYLAPIRVLVRVEDMNREGILEGNYRLVTLCAMCYNTLKRANGVVKEDPDRMRKLHDIMEREQPYEGKVEVLHLLELLREMGFEKVAERVERPLTGLRVAPYYGCLLLRPRGFGIDNPDSPRVMEDLIRALGGEVVEFPYRARCCGSYHTVERKDIVAEAAYKILSQAREMGAEIVALACPLCSFNLSERQDEVEREFPGFRKIPVVYFTQLMALAFGLGEDVCGLDQNHVDPRPLLRSKSLI